MSYQKLAEARILASKKMPYMTHQLMSLIGITCVLQQDPEPITGMLGGMATLLREQQLTPLSSDFDLREFPQNDEVWQADLVHMPVMISNEEVGLDGRGRPL
jgi:hypothetical protein